MPVGSVKLNRPAPDLVNRWIGQGFDLLLGVSLLQFLEPRLDRERLNSQWRKSSPTRNDAIGQVPFIRLDRGKCLFDSRLTLIFHQLVFHVVLTKLTIRARRSPKGLQSVNGFPEVPAIDCIPRVFFLGSYVLHKTERTCVFDALTVGTRDLKPIHPRWAILTQLDSHRAEWGRDDYSLEIKNLPEAPPLSEPASVAVTKGRRKTTNDSMLLFEAATQGSRTR
jgi:hypothetical protein